MKKMMSRLWKTYKKNHGTIPRCICCNVPILVGAKYEPLRGQDNAKGSSRFQKYLCEEHAKLYAEKGSIVYQHPIPNTKKPPDKEERFDGIEGEI